MALLFLAFYSYIYYTILITLITVPIHGFSLFSICKRKGQKHNWMNFIPGLCLYPMLLLTDREFKIAGFIKVKNRKSVALYYIISNSILLLLCVIGKLILFTGSSNPALFANIHFISLILYLIQLVIFRLRAFYDLFMTYEIQENAVALAILSVIYPIIFAVLAYKMEHNYFEKLKNTNISPDQTAI